ncbi:formate hydrogenlyase subunit 3/multisubunit Na+/H+ antiporter MnhD subunit-like protein [Shewanella sediminis HAW-EB3]|uniref:Formate hydrogenlyase subunit 3/multisubunit Na+/H+ antiporter MnhD subunit-like protein n=1 Tax=Shewanella sediminis (strain HAW-EB3) TaxID=425104 RepID=A8FT37_SHESH|nr:proton-conducting transporter membrane subunit [Shewanella sediminis]ABV36010.1 formate hydrogenlyase subunit 3/multisubunit Na+/H+ antiporter MnhD subunit-like protein [Shewanella sediminis HAW-EB3]
MNGIVSAFLLVSALVLPLLLAFPALHRRLPWPVHIALLPAVALVFIPVDYCIELPWFQLGSGLGLDAGSRWWLAISVVVWGVAATSLHAPDGRDVYHPQTSLFLLSLAGQLGAILATDLVCFFAFTTLMGYACIGLLLADADESTRRAGRVYLVLLIFADIILFEAMVMAEAITEDLGFAILAHAVSLTKSSDLYLSIVIVGFALKVGLWPLHIWLPLAYASARPATALLLWVGPVATGLLGIVRWLPLGEMAAPMPGILLQAVGAVTILYVILFGFMRAQRKQLPAYVAIIVTGSFVMGLGAGLSDPALWNRYGDLAPIFIFTVGLGLAIMIVSFECYKAKGKVSGSKRADRTALEMEHWFKAFIRWGRRTGTDTLPKFRASWLARWDELWQKRVWQRAFDAGEYFLQRWSIAVTLFLLLVIVTVVLLLLDARSVL